MLCKEKNYRRARRDYYCALLRGQGKRFLQGGSIKAHFSSTTMSEYEKAVEAYIMLIVTKNLPLSLVEDSEFCKLSKYNVHLSYRTTVRTLIEFFKLVESRIADEMRQTIGALLFDGWSCGGTHYVALIAYYCATMTGGTLDAPQLAIIAVSPMGRQGIGDNGIEFSDETARFDAEAHLDFFRDVFAMMSMSLDDWMSCIVGYSASVNQKLARISRKPFVGYHSHRINIEVSTMLKGDAEIADTVASVLRTMKSAEKLKNWTLLRNITDYCPVLRIETRCSGDLRMLARIVKMQSELKSVFECDESDHDMSTSQYFFDKVSHYCYMLSEIDAVTLSLQFRGHALASCRSDLNVLIESVQENRNKAGTPFHRCELAFDYISSNGSIILNPSFESDVCKIQGKKKTC